jgi:hypothetical protein
VWSSQGFVLGLFSLFSKAICQKKTFPRDENTFYVLSWFELVRFYLFGRILKWKNIAIYFANTNRPLYSIWLVESILLAFSLVDGIGANIENYLQGFWDRLFFKGKSLAFSKFLSLFSGFYTCEERNMSVATYFTNISDVSDRQKRFYCDLGEENLPVWSKYHFDASSSQDSNSSANTSNSSKTLVIFCCWCRKIFQVN